jgi:hypothetical protein
MGNGDGTLQAAVNVWSLGSNASSLGIADLNGDTRADLVVANRGNSTVSVLLGNGNGTFGTPVQYQGFHAPVSIAVGDINGDGKLDVVTAPQSFGIPVSLGNGDGTLQTPQYYSNGNPVPSDVTSVAIADVSGDNRADIIVSNVPHQNISVLLGNAGGGFQPAILYGVNQSNSVAVGDLNLDETPDVVSATTAGQAAIFFGTGNGDLSGSSHYEAGSRSMSVAIADVNGDGRPEIVVANKDSDNVSVLKSGLNFFTFPKVAEPNAGDGPSCVAIGDMNGDGRPDLVVANKNSNNVSILLNTSALYGDLSGNGAIDGLDITLLAECLLNGGNCACGDFNNNGSTDLGDVPLFVDRLLAAS